MMKKSQRVASPASASAAPPKQAAVERPAPKTAGAGAAEPRRESKEVKGNADAPVTESNADADVDEAKAGRVAKISSKQLSKWARLGGIPASVWRHAMS